MMQASPSSHFKPALFAFLEDLKKNNRRDWFQANKQRYEEEVRQPAQQFISDFGPHLRKISRHFMADPRPSGGSLFRIYRDVRFSKDKSPYKTHIGIQFRHKKARDVHAPGFYLHLEPGNVFAGIGIWHPDSPSLGRIRKAIVSQSARWKRITGSSRFREHFKVGGEALKRAPKGYDPDHPLIDDLKRKDFVAFATFGQRDATSPDFLERYATACRAGASFVRFLCDAVGVPF